MKEKEALYSFSNDNYEKDSSNVVKQAEKTDIIFKTEMPEIIETLSAAKSRRRMEKAIYM